jgi:DGQHR domain-containing protein
MNNFGPGINLPAIKGKQGGRTFYVTNLPNAVFESFLKGVESAVEQSQRPLDPRHADQIAEYIRANPEEYVVGALTFAVDREVPFTKMGDQNFGSFDLGTISLGLNTKYHSLDGQHRREAIMQVQKEKEMENIGNDSTAVIFYVEPDLSRKRQMFSDMNSTSKKVSKSLNISFDNRDPFARAAKILITQHPLLIDRVEQLAPRVKADSSDFFSLSSIQDTLKKLYVGTGGRVKDSTGMTDEDIIAKGADFFDVLVKARPEYSEAQRNQSALLKYRASTILFSSTTLRALAGAVYKATVYFDEQPGRIVQDKLVTAISKIDFTVNSKLFIDAGFISAGSPTPSARNQEVIAATNAIYRSIKDGTGNEPKIQARRPFPTVIH